MKKTLNSGEVPASACPAACSGALFPFKKTLTLGASLFFLAFWSIETVSAAEITVPRLELASRGWFVDGDFTVSSRISMDLALSGGYKYSFLLGLSLEAPDVARAFAYRNFNYEPIAFDPADPLDIDDLNTNFNALAEKQKNQAFLGFRVAKATINKPFNLPLSLSYFVGSGDDFCTGDDFSSLFGLYPFGTDFRGFFCFPDGIGGNMLRQYNGVHGAKGTGLSLVYTGWDSFFIPMLYIYQDLAFLPDLFNTGSSVDNLYSGDVRLLFHWKWLSLEAFGGLSWNASMDVTVRSGLMFHLAGKGAEFFAQAGITSWDVGKKLNVDNMYFLIEPRLRFQYFAVHVTFFYHPVEYLHIVEDKEQGKADFNVKLMFGNAESGFTAGLESAVEFNIGDSDDINFRISPFGSFTSGGLLWEAKIRLLPTKLTKPKEMMELFIGVRTAY